LPAATKFNIIEKVAATSAQVQRRIRETSGGCTAVAEARRIQADSGGIVGTTSGLTTDNLIYYTKLIYWTFKDITFQGICIYIKQ
jgi:hypothetical protein